MDLAAAIVTVAGLALVVLVNVWFLGPRGPRR